MCSLVFDRVKYIPKKGVHVMVASDNSERPFAALRERIKKTEQDIDVFYIGHAE